MSLFHSVLRLISFAFLLGMVLPCKALQQPSSIPNSTPIISDTIFRAAVNSPGYLVVKRSDWEAYKKLWSDSIANQKIQLESERAAVKRSLDSLKNASSQPAQTVIESDQSSEKNSVESSGSAFKQNSILLVVLVLFLVVNGLGLFFFFLQKNKQMKDQNERMNLLENELSEYKSSSIQRERKLMRELIDTRQALEEERARQSSDEEEQK